MAFFGSGIYAPSNAESIVLDAVIIVGWFKTASVTRR
jgi:hypothetical protein